MKTIRITISSVLILLLLVSCGSEKKYNYIEIVEEKELFGRDTKIEEKEVIVIRAESDSAAYVKAYEKFCSSGWSAKETAKKLGIEPSSRPLRFKLKNEDGLDIAQTVSFSNKESLEEEISGRIKAIVLDALDGLNLSKNSDFEQKTEIDSLKIAELKKYFKIKSDEFDPNKHNSYLPKNAPSYVNRNGIYCYFFERGGYSNNLRLRIQYHSDNWLFIEKVKFSIDGEAFELIPQKTDRDSGNGGKIWEWIDIPVDGSTIDMISALSTAKSAKMKLSGRQYNKVKNISKQQITDISRVVEMFYAMGGQI